jgi:hypothetical protein
MNIQCPSCKALHWLDECLTRSSKANPKFGTCCYQGKISLPPLQPAPPKLYDLLTNQEPIARAFCNHIRNYNSALAMTSVGRKLDYSVNDGGGPWLYKLNGELIHRAGSLLPPEEGNNDPVYSQLWVIDTEEALDIRMHNQHNRSLDLNTLRSLHNMLYHYHPGVPLYNHAYELICNMPREQQCRILFHFDAACDQRHYNAPDASIREFAVILQGDGDEVRDSQDIIIHRKHSEGL